MSRVYEALKKAQREGLWFNDTSQTHGDADTLEIPSLDRDCAVACEQATLHSSGTSTKGAEQSNQPPGVVGVQDSTRRDGRDFTIETELPEEAVPYPSVLSFGTKFLSRINDWWRLWLSDASTATGPRLIIHQELLARAAEQFQVLRANVESWVLEHNQHLLLVTSALPGEGKSFVALNLAVALSHAGWNVLLVDADLRAPSLHIPFNLVPLGGLLPYLEGRQEFSESITLTPQPGLKLMAAAGVTSLGSELLGGPRMRALIEQIRGLEPVPIVLFDSPATAVGTEVQLLSRLVDGALLVVSANATPRAAVTKALEFIKGVPMVTAVLNRFETSYSTLRHQRHYAKRNVDEQA